NFPITWAGFSLEESSRISTRCCKFLPVIYCKGEKVHCTLLIRRYNGTKHHCITHSKLYRSMCLLCKFSGFEGNGSTITKIDNLFKSFWNHKFFNSNM